MNKTQRPRLQIIRGLPGSGKTTLAMSKWPQLMRLETDMYFYREKEYRFTLDLNLAAVEWFSAMVEDFCRCGFDFVTTGVYAAHTERLTRVVDIALANGYEVYIKTLSADYGSVHRVPKHDLDSMKRAFVPEKELKKLYKGNKQVHFGLMPTKYTLAHLRKKH